MRQARHRGAFKDKRDLEENQEMPSSNASMEQAHEENKATTK
jgi:hypothetical protein